ncbi:hypothetical protein GND98_015920 [Clostridium butyricum]|uniref:O-antigen ligase domain-containing protein n=1 Tax=Clostridium butyricum TaxID=1492 RepID=A0A6L9ERY1_CLOBU|nr:hypothetical protein [Clostridium butyricum]
MGSILNVINSNSTVFLSWGGEKYIPSYYNIYFETQSINIFGIKLIRNTGIFTEAPMYNFVLCISLSVELFLKEKKINSKIAILMITIITTITTTGIVIMSILISLSILFNKNKSNLRSILKYITFPIILLILCGISMKFINDKMNASIGKTASFSVRVDDYKIGFEVLNDYKLNGVGFLNHDFVKSYMNTSERDTDVGGSNSIMIIVSQGGIYLSIIYLVAIISFFVITLKKRQRNLLIFNMIIAILMAVTNIPYTNIILLYLAMGLTSNIEEKNIIYN